MYMILFVLNEENKLDDIIDAWYQVGIKGATIIESTGFNRLQYARVPSRYVFSDSSLLEEGNYTIFAIVNNEETVRLCLQATEKIVGNLDDPNTGVFSAWPLSMAKGLPPAQHPKD